LNILDHFDNSLENFIPHSQSSSISHKHKKQFPSRASNQNPTQNHGIDTTRTQKSPHKSEKNIINNNFSAHRKLLFSPNGRLPNITRHESNFCTQHAAKSNLENNNIPYANDHDASSNLDSRIIENEKNNINVASLNNVFFSLTKNMENMYHIVRAICLPNNENEFFISHFRLPHNTKE